MFTLRSLCAGVLVLSFAAVASAAPVMSISFQYVNAFSNLTTGSTAAPTENGFASTDPGYITVGHSGTFRYRFNALLSLSDPTGGGTSTALAPGQDLANLNFSINLAGQSGGTITPKAAGGVPAHPYTGNTGQYFQDVPTNSISNNVFSTNSDAGTPDDLQGIFVISTDNGTAADRHPGESPRPDPAWATNNESNDGLGYPTILGFVDVIWNGQGTATLSTSTTGTFLALFLNNQNGTGTATAQPDALFNTQTVTLGVPEPASLGLLGVAALVMARRRRA